MSGALLSLISAILAAIVYGLLHWRGSAISPDGWAYWQAAVSIAGGNGYRYFSGDPITAWPPAYPLFLSAWIKLAGPRASTLAVANAALVAGMAAAWTGVSMQLVGRRGRHGTSAALGVAVYLGLLAPLSQTLLTSESLKYLMSALLVWSGFRVASLTRTGEATRWVAASCLFGVLALLSHNSAIASVLAVATATVAWSGAPVADRVRYGLWMLGAPIAVWLAVRFYLGQEGSHPVGLGSGRFSAPAYGMQALFGVGELAGGGTTRWPPMALVLPGLAFLAVWRLLAAERGARYAYFVAGVAASLTLLIFCLTWIADPLGARFLVFIPLLMVPPMILVADRARLMLVLLATVVPLLVTTAVLMRVELTAPDAVRGYSELFVPHDAYVSPDYRSGPPVTTDKGVLMAPVAWQESPRPR